MVQSFKCIDEDKHISLSRHFTLSLHELDIFRAMLSDALQQKRHGSIDLLFTSYELLISKEDIGRAFLAAACVKTSELIGLFDIVDEAMETLGRDKYYEERVAHVSLAEFNSESINHVDLTKFDELLAMCRVNSVIFRAGHKLFEFPL